MSKFTSIYGISDKITYISLCELQNMFKLFFGGISEDATPRKNKIDEKGCFIQNFIMKMLILCEKRTV